MTQSLIGTARSRWNRALRRLWFLPTTFGGVMSLGCVAVVGLRVACMTQLGFALHLSLALSERPTLNAVTAAFFVTESTVVCWVIMRKKSLQLPRLLATDVVSICAIHASSRFFDLTPAENLTWANWGYGVSLSTVLWVSLAAPRFRHAIFAVSMVAACYVFASSANFKTLHLSTSVLTNAGGYVSNVLVARFVWTYLLRLAADADKARRRAALNAASLRAARARAKGWVHDALFPLEQIYLSDRIVEDPDFRRTIRAQAAKAVHELRTFIENAEHVTPNKTLGQSLRSVAEHFPGSQVRVQAALVEELRLPAIVLTEIEHIVNSLLLNVLRHANTDEVTVHGDARAYGRYREWEVTGPFTFQGVVGI